MPQKNEKGGYTPLSGMDFFVLSVISVMPHDVYREIRNRLNLVLTYMEDGAPNTAKDILEKFLNK